MPLAKIPCYFSLVNIYFFFSLSTLTVQNIWKFSTLKRLCKCYKASYNTVINNSHSHPQISSYIRFLEIQSFGYNDGSLCVCVSTCVTFDCIFGFISHGYHSKVTQTGRFKTVEICSITLLETKCRISRC